MYIKKVCGKLVESMNFSTAKQFPRLQQVPLFYQEIICGFCRANNPSKIDSKNVFYNQHIWGNRHLTSNGKCLYMTPFIDAGYMYVKDILNPDGTFKQNIYENLKVKSQYLRSFSMIMSAFKPYKNLRISDGMIFDVKYATENVINKKSNFFYNKLREQITIISPIITKLPNMFGYEICVCSQVCHQHFVLD